MTYELIQSALTALINVTAIAGFSAIALHAIYTSHRRFMSEYCPQVTPYTQVDSTLLTPDIAPQTELPAVIDPWQAEITTSSPRYWVARQPEATTHVLMLCPAAAVKTKTTRKPANKTKTPAKPRTTRKRKAA